MPPPRLRNANQSSGCEQPRCPPSRLRRSASATGNPRVAPPALPCRRGRAWSAVGQVCSSASLRPSSLPWSAAHAAWLRWRSRFALFLPSPTLAVVQTPPGGRLGRAGDTDPREDPSVDPSAVPFSSNPKRHPRPPTATEYLAGRRGLYYYQYFLYLESLSLSLKEKGGVRGGKRMFSHCFARTRFHGDGGGRPKTHQGVDPPIGFSQPDARGEIDRTCGLREVGRCSSASLSVPMRSLRPSEEPTGPLEWHCE